MIVKGVETQHKNDQSPQTTSQSLYEISCLSYCMPDLYLTCYLDNKSYLKQVRINDYVKKWQEEEEKKMPAKRKAVPKVDNDFVTTSMYIALYNFL